jgi:serine/threonine-protein kinase
MLDGRYRLMRLLGEGGIGAVYQGEHILMRKPVAVKILKREAAAERDVVMRFVREAQVSSRLSNPHCVTVHDFGQTPDRSLYLVMELIDGESLRERLLREPKLPLHLSYQIIAQLLDALAAAHDIGVTHRDVKPENIMLIEDPERGGQPFLKLLDFGIARPIEPMAAGVTRAGFTVGTPGYIAPEQALGKTVDGRADLYAAGVILYEMLCGQRPFQGRSPMEVINNQLSAPLRAPSKVASGLRIPPAFESALMRVLSKDPEKRFAGPKEFKSALEHALDGNAPPLPSPPRPSSVSDDELLQAAGARRSTYVFLGALLGILLGAGGMYALSLRQPPPKVVEAPHLRPGALSESEKLEAAGDLGAARASVRALPKAELATPDAQARLAVLSARDGDWSEARASLRAARALGAVPTIAQQVFLTTAAGAPKDQAQAAQLAVSELGAAAQGDLLKMLASESPALRDSSVRFLVALHDADPDRTAWLGRALETAACPEQRAILALLSQENDPAVLQAVEAFARTPKGQDACIRSALDNTQRALEGRLDHPRPGSELR